MKASQEIKNWWVSALLSEQTSAHPVFGRNVHAHVEEGVVTLTGSVDSADEREAIEREAEHVEGIKAVINHLQISQEDGPFHLQTVIATYPDVRTAGVGRQSIASSRIHEGWEAEILEGAEGARPCLWERFKAAGLTEADMQPYLDQLGRKKALLVDRVPEDDAFRIISALEGSRAETIRTLPPEPDAFEER